MNQRFVSFKPLFHFVFILCQIAPFIATTGCARYIIPSEDFFNQAEITQNQMEASHHSLYQVIPRHRSQIQWYDIGHWTTWVLFGNDDDGIFGEMTNYRPDQSCCLLKALCWQCRNPLHNFCFYVIGSAYRRNSELDLLKIGQGKISSGDYRPVGCTVFPYKSSCFYLALHGGKPFISLRLAYTKNVKSEFYLGWRERGNFGIKFLPIKKTNCAPYALPLPKASDS